MKNIRLIASDLDGTLLLNGAQFPSAEALKLIHELHEKGILFMADSGREYQNLKLIFAPVKDEIIFMCQNGCQAYYKGERLAAEVMDQNLAYELIRQIQNTDGLETEVCGLEHVWIHAKKESYKAMLSNTAHIEYIETDDLFHIDDQITKVTIYKEDGFTPADKVMWQKKYSDRCNIQISGACWCDFISKNADKGTCFKKMLKHFNVASGDTVVFGDNENDLGILAEAGTAVAVESAIPRVLAAADRTTDTVEHAMKQILEGTF